MIELHDLLHTFVILFAVIDPVGTVPVFLAVTNRHEHWEKQAIARQAILVSAGVLVFFIAAGQFILEGIQVPLAAFQVAGGIVLFLFALSMIFGAGKPEDEMKVIRSGKETAIFPLAIPSIASPGAMLAVVLLTDNHRFSILHQIVTTIIMLIVLLITWIFMRAARHMHHWIGDSGASIISRVMGLILASVAANNTLEGIRLYFAQSLP